MSTCLNINLYVACSKLLKPWSGSVFIAFLSKQNEMSRCRINMPNLYELNKYTNMNVNIG